MKMKTNIEEITLRKYLKPVLQRIKLDNKISLALESSPPIGPDESMNTQDSFNNSAFKTTNC
jgi:hypothetical protein